MTFTIWEMLVFGIGWFVVGFMIAMIVFSAQIQKGLKER